MYSVSGCKSPGVAGGEDAREKTLRLAVDPSG